MIRLFKRVLRSEDSHESVVECRRCGANLESADVDHCPACGSSEVASYRL
ncbi:hypothetical protein C444_07595 [Haloarcula japonica DSM 6131]|uniref:Small CPxCG-related zinc finger protein n=1 Tax=Haloarcula japonica (strain ATCC 49778 / DSM 6131 / JCM 7785 / NBRC 101032 / NCIMB 13157 / TR-1) TaxID=1227453 RepID=M0LED0_HALJT|nr:hypothetical protein C444_07595 [Haloarcula japonica DSM 6131]